jgi:hypothetical protein
LIGLDRIGGEARFAPGRLVRTSAPILLPFIPIA